VIPISADTPMLTFRGRIEIVGVNPYVRVSAARARRLKSGWRKPLPVRVQINGAPTRAWRINLMPRGDGSFYLYLAGIVRGASHTKVGDRVDVQMRFDEKYRGGPAHRMPAWFKQSLRDNPLAMQGWRGLSPSRKKEILRYLVRLKSQQAQARNATRAVRVLAGAQERYMARDWNRPRKPSSRVRKSP
jgi:hypothetical protein